MINTDFLYEPEFFSKDIYREHYVEKELSYTSYDKAYIVPSKGKGSGVYTERKEFINGISLADNDKVVPLIEDEVIAESFCDETVVYLGICSAGWGHVITDVISRFWFLKGYGYLKEFDGCKLVLLNYDKGVIKNIDKLFEILELDESQLAVLDGITQYRRIIIPDRCFFTDKEFGQKFFTLEYRKIINTIRSCQKKNLVVDKTCERMYFSYVKYGAKRNHAGEEKLEKFFKEQGYKIVYPEMYSLKEQLNMLANCHYFASTVGSCAHNTLFLPKNANVILIPRAYCLTYYQEALNNVIDLNITYIDSSLSILAEWQRIVRGPFYFYVSENLKSFFGIDTPNDKNYYMEQFADFEEYVRGGVLKGLEKMDLPPYYGRQFMYCMQKLGKLYDFEFDIRKCLAGAKVSICGMNDDYINSREMLKDIAIKHKCLIYCAGKVARCAIGYLASEGIGVEAVLVTSPQGNPKEILGVPVYVMSEYAALNSLEDKNIIVCVMESMHAEIGKALSQYDVGKIFYLANEVV